MNTTKFILRDRNNLLTLIIKNDIELNYIIHIDFIDLKLEQIEKSSVYLSQIIDYGIT